MDPRAQSPSEGHRRIEAPGQTVVSSSIAEASGNTGDRRRSETTHQPEQRDRTETTPRFAGLIRIARVEDAAAVAAIKAPYVRDTAYNFAWEPPTAAAVVADIAQTLQRYPYLVAENAGANVVGFAQAEPVRHRESDQWAVELSVYVTGSAHGSGIGSALYQRLLELLRQQGILDAYACITAENVGSIDFHKRLGFAEVGRFPSAGFKLGAWHDTVWMHQALGRHVCPPNPVIPFSQLIAPSKRPRTDENERAQQQPDSPEP